MKVKKRPKAPFRTNQLDNVQYSTKSSLARAAA